MMPKTHTIRSPFTDNVAADIDDMLRDLYRRVEAAAAVGVDTSTLQTLTEGAVVRVAEAPIGVLTVVNIGDEEMMQYQVLGTGAVSTMSGTGAFSAVKDNPATINVYYDSDAVYLQNLIAGTVKVWFSLTGYRA